MSKEGSDEGVKNGCGIYVRLPVKVNHGHTLSQLEKNYERFISQSENGFALFIFWLIIFTRVSQRSLAVITDYVATHNSFDTNKFI